MKILVLTDQRIFQTKETPIKPNEKEESIRNSPCIIWKSTQTVLSPPYSQNCHWSLMWKSIALLISIFYYNHNWLLVSKKIINYTNTYRITIIRIPCTICDKSFMPQVVPQVVDESTTLIACKYYLPDPDNNKNWSRYELSLAANENCRFSTPITAHTDCVTLNS